MLNLKYVLDETTGEQHLETSLTGKLLLNTTLLNKGTAFSHEERSQFELHGKLPQKVESLSDQVSRAYAQYKRYQTDLSRNIYLNNLRDRNETVFYKLLSEHIIEMMPMIYTPIVGTAVKQYSKEFRSPRGLYLCYEDRHDISMILNNRSHPDVDLIVITDGAGVLGIGDQGVGAMDIPVAKLMVYSLFGGVHPSRTLPIMLDVGTNNEDLLNDPYYLGSKHRRIEGDEYDNFVNDVLTVIRKQLPSAFIHWEDLGQINAARILENYRDKFATFNDDIQGTGAVCLAGLMAASKAIAVEPKDHKIVVFGAGTAGMGITEQIYLGLLHTGLSEQEAKDRIWLIDRPGLLTDEIEQVTPEQAKFLRKASDSSSWERVDDKISLLEVIKQVKPTILLGCSAMSGAFNQEIIETMAKHCARPIIFPLSNPTERAEAHPNDILRWTQGKAIIATGSPFKDVTFEGQTKIIPQCNNALVFPGIGLGVLTAKAKLLTDGMIAAACNAVADCAPILEDDTNPVLPSIEQARNISKIIGIHVAEQAIKEGVAQLDDNINIEQRVENIMWSPEYLPIKKV